VTAASITQGRQLWRLTRLALHVLLGLWLCALILPRRSPPARQRHIRKWSLALLQIFGVRVEFLNESLPIHASGRNPTLQPGVIVANHLSWLDIFVINTLQPCRFVAKAEIRGWPLLGYLCSSTRTIFIARGSARDVRKIFQQLAQSIKDGDHVAFFPEGTTAAQGALLPFHANLFEAAIDAGVPIQPVALRYLDRQGNPHSEIDYTGDITFTQSMMRILRSPTVQAQIILLPAIASDIGNRRALASAVQRSIAAALDHPPGAEGF